MEITSSPFILFISFVIHFLLTVVLGAMFGIYTCVLSFALLSVFLINAYAREKDDYGIKNGAKTVIFGTFSFSGTLLVAFALRQLFEAIFPTLSYKLNVMVLTRSDFLSVWSVLYIVFSSVALALIPTFTVGRGMSDSPKVVRYVSAGVLTGLFALNIPAFVSFVLFGILALYLYENGVGTPYIILYSLLFSFAVRFTDNYATVADSAYGAAVGVKNSLSMLVLYLGVSITLASVGKAMISKKEKRPIVYIFVGIGILVTVIGCVTVQYFNR